MQKSPAFAFLKLNMSVVLAVIFSVMYIWQCLEHLTVLKMKWIVYNMYRKYQEGTSVSEYDHAVLWCNKQI